MEIESRQCCDCGDFAVNGNADGQYCESCYSMLPLEDENDWHPSDGGHFQEIL